MKYPLVRDLAADGVPVAVTCRVLGFSKQAFYAWRADPVSRRDWDEAHLINAAADIHADDPAFGYRFIADELAARGIHAGENRVARLCSQQQLWSVFSKKRGLSRQAGPQNPAGVPRWLVGLAGRVGQPRAAGYMPGQLCSWRSVCGDDFGAAVRRIGVGSGWLATVAGDGVAGGGGNGGLAADASLNDTSGSDGLCTIAAAADPAGNLLIAVGGAVRVVAARTGMFYRQPMLAGHIYLIPHAGLDPVDVRADRWRNLVTVSGQGPARVMPARPTLPAWFRSWRRVRASSTASRC